MKQPAKESPISRKRNPNLDLIRCTAVFCVVLVHFFAHTGFYSRPTTGRIMPIMSILRTFAMVCVPLFLLLTGFLCSKKPLSKQYFKGIVPVLLTYLLACLFTLTFRILVLEEQHSLLECLFQILKIGMGAVQYAWYIEMYLGLYLLIPFLNILWQGLPSKREKRLLLAILFFMTVLPSSINTFTWSMDPDVQTMREFLPAWWAQIWPVTYYFIGAYIREFDISLSKMKNGLCFAVCVVVFGIFNFWRSNGAFFFYIGDNWGGFQQTIQSVLLFLLLLHLDLSKLPDICNRLLGKLSRLSLGIYLCSFISDTLVYKFLWDAQARLLLQLLWMPLAVCTSFLIAAGLSSILFWIQGWLTRRIPFLGK